MNEPLEPSLESPDRKRRYVRRMFATIADRYDLITVLLSFGRDRGWKRRLVELAAPGPGDRVLDLACGTGDIAFESRRRGARVVGLDITERMIELARQRASALSTSTSTSTMSRQPSWIVADMCALPVTAAAVTVVTTGYGLRNVPDLPQALGEIHRVLAPGGRIVSLDFDRPDAAWLRAIYLNYLHVIGGALGWLLHRDPDTYRYIPASIRRYPGARAVADMMRALGFSDVRHVRVLGGLMAIHIARKASDP